MVLKIISESIDLSSRPTTFSVGPTTFQLELILERVKHHRFSGGWLKKHNGGLSGIDPS
jgi:hypothetical protein